MWWLPSDGTSIDVDDGLEEVAARIHAVTHFRVRLVQEGVHLILAKELGGDFGRVSNAWYGAHTTPDLAWMGKT